MKLLITIVSLFLKANLFAQNPAISGGNTADKLRLFPGIVAGYVDRIEHITVNNQDGSHGEKSYLVTCTNELVERCWLVEVRNLDPVIWSRRWYAFSRGQFPIGNPDMRLVAGFNASIEAILPLIAGTAPIPKEAGRLFNTRVLFPIVTNQSAFQYGSRP